MIMKIAAMSAALLLGTMSQAAFAQLAPTAPAAGAGTAAPAVKPPVAVPPKPVATAPKTIVGAKAPPPVNACKGLAEADCGTKVAECSFVKAYVTKTGRKVPAVCRKNGTPRAATAKAAAKPAAVPATAVKPPALPPAAKPAAPAAPPKN